MPISPAVSQSMPLYKRLCLPLLNLVGKKNEFRIIVSSPDYIEVRILWGLFSFEKGEKKEIVVRGTDAYVAAVVSSLVASLDKRYIDVKKMLLLEQMPP